MAPSARLLWLSLLPLPPLLYDQYLRSLYPTRPVSPALEIARRTDRPVGHLPPRAKAGPPEWAPCAAGDCWTALVPRVWLTRQSENPTVGLETVFARAFWNSWPLALEAGILRAAMAAGSTFFQRRAEQAGLTAADRRNYVEGTALFGGTGIVSAKTITQSNVQRCN